MFKHYFERIEGIEIYPLISLIIFFLFFLSLLVWVLRVDKSYIKTMKELPFAKNNENHEKQ
ncbi:cytochrome C oxidase Cbb3 [Cytophagales bacterium LB-30]|uniref:Cytochrome C oxidase Cbb3 n=1 Tax=Shiella aurantiaca TaxID=3058365 RepID=A0ABT8F292_9BACT|nr:cytochrome C oxidase Cbb3 [Shiella aurantiaca]MDN4164577.1 cytochrome C oxidase Cbb3 [Shiella aurantiaca]